jgi:1-acyl-sn-glycerol-3-phosphate acyltransferase
VTPSPSSLATILRTGLGLSVVGLDTAIFGTGVIVAAPLLGATHPFVNACYRAWGRGVLLGCGARLRTRGADRLDPAGRYVFVANHLSDLDPPAILASLRHHAVRFVAKEELARIPLLGQALRAGGNVVISRSDTRGDVARLDAQRELLERVSVFFFAEGTRSATGELGPFKRGAAAFALKAGMPLVPVGVHGTLEILPRGLRVQRWGTVGVSIGEPVPVEGESLEARAALTELLRERVRAEIDKAKELAAAP